MNDNSQMTTLQDSLGYWIIRMGQVMHKDLCQRLNPHEISARVLSVLMAIDTGQAVTPSAIADFMQLDRAIATRVLKELQERGFVRSIRNNADRRSRTIVLTDEGRAIGALGASCARDSDSYFADQMPDGQADAIRELFQKLVASELARQADDTHHVASAKQLEDQFTA